MKVGTHKERVQRVRDFTEKNRLFTVIAIAIIVLLISNFLISKDENSANYSPQTETSQTETSEAEIPPWRFYWTDLVILVVVGGFCTVKIIQERRKAREKL